MMSDIELLQGDVLELLPSIASKSADLVIADPPYNLAKDYGNNHDIRGFEEYIAFSRNWLREAHRILKPN